MPFFNTAFDDTITSNTQTMEEDDGPFGEIDLDGPSARGNADFLANERLEGRGGALDALAFDFDEDVHKADEDADDFFDPDENLEKVQKEGGSLDGDEILEDDQPNKKNEVGESIIAEDDIEFDAKKKELAEVLAEMDPNANIDDLSDEVIGKIRDAGENTRLKMGEVNSRKEALAANKEVLDIKKAQLSALESAMPNRHQMKMMRDYVSEADTGGNGALPAHMELHRDLTAKKTFGRNVNLNEMDKQARQLVKTADEMELGHAQLRADEIGLEVEADRLEQLEGTLDPDEALYRAYREAREDQNAANAKEESQHLANEEKSALADEGYSSRAAFKKDLKKTERNVKAGLTADGEFPLNEKQKKDAKAHLDHLKSLDSQLYGGGREDDESIEETGRVRLSKHKIRSVERGLSDGDRLELDKSVNRLVESGQYENAGEAKQFLVSEYLKRQKQ